MKMILFVLFLIVNMEAKELNTKIVGSKIGKEAMVLEIGASGCQACKEMSFQID